MRVIKHLPILSLQEAVYGLLEKGQTAQVYRAVPPHAEKSPYITIGLCTVKPEDTKEDAHWPSIFGAPGRVPGISSKRTVLTRRAARHLAHRLPSKQRKSTKPSTTSAT